MSNNEIFERIFQEVSTKIIKEYLKNINIVKINDKYRYEHDLKISPIISALNDNLIKISNYLVNNLEIEDKKSVIQILKKHFNSRSFKKSLSNFELIVESTNKLDIFDLRRTYSQHLKFYLTTGYVKEKIFALSKDTNFKGWVQNKWKVVSFGYCISIFILMITYYVFINK